jgi:dihydroflavonol-4-reductase
MHVVIAGGAGFVGRALARNLLARGVTVTVLDRESAHAPALRAAGADVRRTELTDAVGIESVMRGAHAVVNAAGWYAVGIGRDQRPAMTASNVIAARRVMDAAMAAGVPHIVHVSTFGIFGNTRGRAVDESYRRPAGDPLLSWYDKTKLEAHLSAEARRARGAPVSIALLGAAYGIDDPSGLGDQLRRAAAGRLPAVASGSLGVSWAHVDDIADGLARIIWDAPPGEDWNLGGELGTLADGIAVACAAAGRRPPVLEAPATLVRMLGRLGPGVTTRLGYPANLAEAVRCTEGITYWGTHAKAARRLGYAPRPMDEGFAEVFGAREA